MSVEKIKEGEIKIKVMNQSKCFDAVNMNVEVCALNDVNGSTNHFQIDKAEFIILPSNKSKNGNPHERDFKCTNSNNEILDQVILGKKKIRIRIHANHSFSGFGKAIEEIFEYKNGNFIKDI